MGLQVANVKTVGLPTLSEFKNVLIRKKLFCLQKKKKKRIRNLALWAVMLSIGFIAVTFAGSPPHAEHLSMTDVNILLGSLQKGVRLQKQVSLCNKDLI